MATTTVETGSAPPEPRVPKRSALACTRCRQQKMRCINSGPSPPCERCRKSGSICIFEPPAPPPPPLRAYMAYPTPVLSSGISMTPYLEQVVAPVYSPQQTSPPQSGPVSASLHSGSIASIGSLEPPNALSPADSNDSRARKRRRIQYSHDPPSGSPQNQGQSPAMVDSRDSPPSASSPYQMVQDFEAVHRPQKTPSEARAAPTPVPPLYASAALSLPFETMLSRSATGTDAVALCLDAVNLNLTDAKEMYGLFGEHVASYTPWLHDTDFSTLPEDPLWALASIRVMARYLPGASPLMSRLDHVIGGLLRHVMFDDRGRSYDSALETMKGLGVLYGYSEVSVAAGSDDFPKQTLDTLSIKGIAEGYAVRWHISKARPDNSLGCLMWLWLYTMSNTYSTLLGCPRTIPGGRAVQQAQDIVQHLKSNPQIGALLGEVALCALSDPECPRGIHDGLDSDSSLSLPPELVDTASLLRHFNLTPAASAGAARRLQYHCLFARFYWLSIRQRKPRDLNAASETLQAAQEFLRCITDLSPVVKGRIRYMAEFGFVTLVFVCSFVLRLLEYCKPCLDDGGNIASVEEAAHRAELVRDVEAVADLLTSLSANEGSVTAAYGRALRGACRAFKSAEVARHNFRGPSCSAEAAPGGLLGRGGLGVDACGQMQGLGTFEPDDAMSMVNAQLRDGHGSTPAAGGGGGTFSPWFGSFVDVPDRALLDALDVPWQY